MWIPETNMKTLIAILICFSFAACATTGGNSVADKASQFANSPAGVTLQTALINAALNAATQYSTSGKVDSQKIVAATLDGSADSIRSLVQTPQATSPQAVASATTTGSGLRSFDNTVAPVVTKQVMVQIEHGTSPGQSIENVATTMNKAAAKARKKR
jgi:hypothetical protein